MPEDAADKLDQTKDRMRAALERKRQQQHPHGEGSGRDGKVDHSARAAGGKREFRRKSG